MRGFHGEHRLIEYPFMVTPSPTKTDIDGRTYTRMYLASTYYVN